MNSSGDLFLHIAILLIVLVIPQLRSGNPPDCSPESLQPGNKHWYQATISVKYFPELQLPYVGWQCAGKNEPLSYKTVFTRRL